MKPGRTPTPPVVRQALLAAAVMMAWQVAGKATRDSLFLSAFPSTALPAMMGGAAVCSILMAVLNAALLRRFGPARIIPLGYLIGTWSYTQPSGSGCPTLLASGGDRGLPARGRAWIGASVRILDPGE